MLYTWLLTVKCQPLFTLLQVEVCQRLRVYKHHCRLHQLMAVSINLRIYASAIKPFELWYTKLKSPEPKSVALTNSRLLLCQKKNFQIIYWTACCQCVRSTVKNFLEFNHSLSQDSENRTASKDLINITTSEVTSVKFQREESQYSSNTAWRFAGWWWLCIWVYIFLSRQEVKQNIRSNHISIFTTEWDGKKENVV